MPDALVQPLRPLKPSQEELQNCVSAFRAQGWRLGKEIRPEQLWSALETSLSHENSVLSG